MTSRHIIHPVILCGGSGTRLWPLSRKSAPKQFARLLGEDSLFQSTVRRFEGKGFKPPLIMASEPTRFTVVEQLAALHADPAAILIEPEGRNTAPAILAAALWLEKHSPDVLMLVTPSDHALPDSQTFQKTIHKATDSAAGGDLVTFGIQPNRPETGYGYLHRTTKAREDGTYALSAFVEKPDLKTAKQMLAQGDCLWNAGIFLFSVQAILTAFRHHAPDMIPPVSDALEEAQSDLGFLRLAPGGWCQLPDISIDYAIMEKASNLAVMPYEGNWSDLGGWDAVWQASEPDDNGMVCSGQTIAIDCTDSLLRSEQSDIELVGIGLDDIIAVATSDAVIVARKSQSQRVGEAVSALGRRNAPQAEKLLYQHRPWGWYESLAIGARFQVKRIVVHPGAALSLQSHKHRAEHWIVVAGIAKVTIDAETCLISENQSVYIPRLTRHRLENPGNTPMILIEVQTGAYLGEDDIIRHEDRYGRPIQPSHTPAE